MTATPKTAPQKLTVAERSRRYRERMSPEQRKVYRAKAKERRDRSPRWTDSKRERAEQLIAGGHVPANIAEHVGVTERMVLALIESMR